MWVMISCDNRVVCQQTLNNLEPVEKGILIINGGLDDYVGLDVPKGWDALRLTEVRGQNEILNQILKLHPDEEYYGLIPDNCIIECVDWENKLKAISKGRYVVICNDGNTQNFPFTGVRIWPGDVIRSVEWWGLPGSFTTGFEWAWTKIAWDMVIWERAPDIKITYMPRAENQMDAEIKKHEEADKLNFDIWRKTKYYKTFRTLMFGGDKWVGRTNFPMGDDNGKETGQTSTAQEDGDIRQAL